jgi:mono/diheme cytochrome c family protein
MRGKMIISMSLVLAGSLAFRSWGGDSNGKTAKDSPRLITSIEGEKLFKAYCAACHGVDAKGNGPFAPALKVVPPDLTRIAERNRGMFPMGRIERIIAGDEALPSGHGPGEMPVWGPVFSHVDRDQDLGRVRIDNLTRYLISIQTRASAGVR